MAGLNIVLPMLLCKKLVSSSGLPALLGGLAKLAIKWVNAKLAFLGIKGESGLTWQVHLIIYFLFLLCYFQFLYSSGHLSFCCWFIQRERMWNSNSIPHILYIITVFKFDKLFVIWKLWAFCGLKNQRIPETKWFIYQ